MSLVICLKCNTENEENRKFCSLCGEKLIEDQIDDNEHETTQEGIEASLPEQTAIKPRRKWFKRLIITLIVTITIIGLFFAGNIILFNVANKCYDNAEYGTALKFYKVVVPIPSAIYPEIEEKKQNAETMIIAEKEAARAVVAIVSESPYGDIDNIEKIYTARGTAVGIMYGNETVLVIQKVNNNNCTYFVSKESLEEFETNYPQYYNSEFDLYIHGVGEDNSSKGWLSGAWNMVTNVYSGTIASYGKQINVDNVKNIVKQYRKTQDNGVFK